MALTTEQQTALDALKGVDPTELADAFHATHGPAAQIINDRGHASATKAKAQEVKALEKKLEAEQQAREKAEAKLKEADPAKVHEQYQAEIKDLNTKHEAEVLTLKRSGAERERGRDLAHLDAELATRLKPMARRAVLNDPATASRFQYAEDGTRQILQPGKDVPYTPAKGKNELAMLAEDLIEGVKAIDPDSVLVNGKPGGGSGGGGGGGSTASDPVANYTNNRFAPAKPAAS